MMARMVQPGRRARHDSGEREARAHGAPRLVHRLPIDAQNRLRDARRALRAALYRCHVVPSPRKARIHLTDVCNFRCPTCTKWEQRPGAAELSTEQWCAVLGRLARLPRLREVVLSGGEPFARADIFDLVAAAGRLGFRVSLVTNGWLVDGETLAKLQESGADQLVVSLNSLREEVHDASRAMAGSHRRIMRLLAEWREGGRRPRICISTIVMESNCGELAALALAAQEWGTDGIVFQPVGATVFHHAFTAHERMPAPPPRWWANDLHWVRDPSVVGVQRAELLRLRRRGVPILNSAWHLRRLERYFRDPESVPEIPCLGTLDALEVDPLGNIRLCGGLGPIGNALADDPLEAWRSPRAAEVRRASRTCPHMCRLLNCNV